MGKAQGTRHKGQGTRDKVQGTRHKVQGTRQDSRIKIQDPSQKERVRMDEWPVGLQQKYLILKS